MNHYLTCLAYSLCCSLTIAAGQPATDAPPYKCLFNHELLIISSKKENSREYIQSFIDKLAATDVDAVMCCPTMWRANLFPSEVDPTWKRYRPDQPLSKFRSWDSIMRYVPDKLRLPMAEGLKRITDVEFLKNQSKDYVISRGFGTFPATNEKTLCLVIPDNTAAVKFSRAVLRVETSRSCSDQQIAVELNGKLLESIQREDTELFPPLANNDGYPTSAVLKFYAVPLDLLTSGSNQVKLTKLSPKKGSCQFASLEIAIYR